MLVALCSPAHEPGLRRKALLALLGLPQSEEEATSTGEARGESGTREALAVIGLVAVLRALRQLAAAMG